MENKKCHCNCRAFVAVGIMLAVFVIDQIIKVAVKTNMHLYESIEVTDWFQIYFIENRGMAFGMDFIGTTFLSIFRIIAIIIFCVLLVRIIRRRLPIGLIACVSLVVAGAMGNIIDNFCYGMIFTESTPFQVSSLVGWGEGYGQMMSGRVVDMFYFPLFTWPEWMPWVGGDVFFGAVFNFADAAISCGAVAILIFYNKYIIDKKEDTNATSDPSSPTNE
ncbi:MAG: lipoprotein signal peptidase [Bacteroidaceae bacterium]|nr:lipoprotein signal peptidase [Bacteroidaceae bacterium]